MLLSSIPASRKAAQRRLAFFPASIRIAPIGPLITKAFPLDPEYRDTIRTLLIRTTTTVAVRLQKGALFLMRHIGRKHLLRGILPRQSAIEDDIDQRKDCAQSDIQNVHRQTPIRQQEIDHRENDRMQKQPQRKLLLFGLHVHPSFPPWGRPRTKGSLRERVCADLLSIAFKKP